MHYKIFVLSFLNYCMCSTGCSHTEMGGPVEPIQAIQMIYDTLQAQHD